MGCQEGSDGAPSRNPDDSDLFAKLSGSTELRLRIRPDETLGARPGLGQDPDRRFRGAPAADCRLCAPEWLGGAPWLTRATTAASMRNAC
jgi:hypothetical protein